MKTVPTKPVGTSHLMTSQTLCQSFQLDVVLLSGQFFFKRTLLVGGLNPSEILVELDHFPSRGENQTYLKPPPRLIFNTNCWTYLKNMRKSNWIISLGRGEKTNIWNHHPGKHVLTISFHWTNKNETQLILLKKFFFVGHIYSQHHQRTLVNCPRISTPPGADWKQTTLSGFSAVVVVVLLRPLSGSVRSGNFVSGRNGGKFSMGNPRASEKKD